MFSLHGIRFLFLLAHRAGCSPCAFDGVGVFNGDVLQCDSASQVVCDNARKCKVRSSNGEKHKVKKGKPRMEQSPFAHVVPAIIATLCLAALGCMWVWSWLEEAGHTDGVDDNHTESPDTSTAAVPLLETTALVSKLGDSAESEDCTEAQSVREHLWPGRIFVMPSKDESILPEIAFRKWPGTSGLAEDEEMEIKVESILGEGAFGVVASVTDSRGQSWAVKVVAEKNSWQCTEEAMVLELLRAQGYVQRGHVFAPRLIASVCLGGGHLHALVMQRATCNLHSMRLQNASQFVHVMWAMCSTLHHLNLALCIHGDIKPENILWLQDDNDPIGGWPMLADFGCRFQHTNVRGLDSDLDSAFFVRAAVGGQFGTTSVSRLSPKYAAPEILQAFKAGKQMLASPGTDMWSLGKTLREIAGLIQSDLDRHELERSVVMRTVDRCMRHRAADRPCALDIKNQLSLAQQKMWGSEDPGYPVTFEEWGKRFMDEADLHDPHQICDIAMLTALSSYSNLRFMSSKQKLARGVGETLQAEVERVHRQYGVVKNEKMSNRGNTLFDVKSFATEAI